MADRLPNNALVADLSRELLDDLDSMVDELFDTIVAAEEPYVPELRDELRTSTRANLRSALQDLAAGGAVTVDEPRRTARRRADQGVPLETVLHAFGLAFRVIWNRMIDLAAPRGPDQLEELLRGGAVVWDAIDAYSEVVAVEYRQRLAQLARRDEQQRAARMGALFDGEVTDWALVRGMAAAVDLPPTGRFVVVSAEPVGPDDEALPDVEQHLARNGLSSAWVMRPEGQAGVVAVTRQRSAMAVVGCLGEVATTRVGVSPTFERLGDAGNALALAVVARRTVAPDTAAVGTLDQVPVAALIAGTTPAVATHVVGQVLGGVLELADEEREVLLDTLVAWFDSGGSTSNAGEVLFCHRNTVRNRLNRISEVIGRDVQDPRVLADLQAALHARRLLVGDLED